MAKTIGSVKKRKRFNDPITSWKFHKSTRFKAKLNNAFLDAKIWLFLNSSPPSKRHPDKDRPPPFAKLNICAMTFIYLLLSLIPQIDINLLR